MLVIAYNEKDGYIDSRIIDTPKDLPATLNILARHFAECADGPSPSWMLLIENDQIEGKYRFGKDYA